MKWVLVQGSGNGVDHEVKKVVALSAGMVEALAGLYALEWAFHKNMTKICIKMDCAEFVRGVRRPEEACSFMQPILLDFISLCPKFVIVKLMKVSRSDVRASHNLPRAAVHDN